jgi:hypothetical protein
LPFAAAEFGRYNSRLLMATTLTINDVDAQTMARLQDEARRRGVEVAALARELLDKALGSTQPPPSDGPSTGGHRLGPFHDLDFLAGRWSEADLAEFEAATEQFRQIDPEIWK